MIRLLLSARADAQRTDQFGQTALAIALAHAPHISEPASTSERPFECPRGLRAVVGELVAAGAAGSGGRDEQSRVSLIMATDGDGAQAQTADVF